MGWVTDNRYLSQSEQENNANIIIAYFRSQGIEDRAIAAILGNIQAESTFSPTLTEVGGGGGYGLVQWTPQSDLINACSTLGLSPYTSGDVQIQVILKEILGQPASVNQWYTSSGFISNYYNSGASSDMIGITGQQFISNSMNWSPDKLAILFMAGYERPSYNPNVNHYTARQQYALDWYNYMGGVQSVVYNIPFHSTFYVTSLFGWRLHPIYGDYRLHKGIDLVGTNTTIYATCNGEVVLNEWSSSYGWHVLIKDNSAQYGNYYHHFCHMQSQSSLVIGQMVTRDTVVGIMGATGNVTGAHLHYEITKELYSNDESDYMNPAEYMGIPNEVGTYNYEDYPTYDDNPQPQPQPTPKKKKYVKPFTFINRINIDIRF